MGAILLTQIIMACVIIPPLTVNLSTKMETASVTITVLMAAETVLDLLTKTVTVSATTIPLIHHKEVAAPGGDVVEDKADAVDK